MRVEENKTPAKSWKTKTGKGSVWRQFKRVGYRIGLIIYLGKDLQEVLAYLQTEPEGNLKVLDH